MTLVKGILHVHSRFSYDGKNTLEEIARHAIARGYSFVGMAEHSDTLNQEIMSTYVKSCAEVSSSSLLIIPGIEFTCDNKLHLIGLGVRHYTDIKNPMDLARFIRQEGKLSIVAHPARYKYQIPSGLGDLIDGIEVWNAGYDGRFVPNSNSLRLWDRLRCSNGDLLAFGGQDLHRISNHIHIEISLFCDSLSEENIFAALKRGKFSISNPYFKLKPDERYAWYALLRIQLGRAMYRIARLVRNWFM